MKNKTESPLGSSETVVENGRVDISSCVSAMMMYIGKGSPKDSVFKMKELKGH